MSTIAISGLVQGPSSTAGPVRPAAAPSDWRVGLVLEPVVRARSADGRTLEIEIAGRLLAARAAPGLTVGDRFTARIEQLGPRPVLRVLYQPVPESPREAAVGALLRRVLPLQTPLADALGALRAGAGAGASAGAVDTATARTISEATARLPAPATVSDPEGLRAALEDSGLLFEGRVAAASRSGSPTREFPNADLKGILLRTLAALRSAAPAGNAARPVAPVGGGALSPGTAGPTVPTIGGPASAAPDGATLASQPAADPGTGNVPRDGAVAPTASPSAGRSSDAPARAAPRGGGAVSAPASDPPPANHHSAIGAARAALARIEHNQVRSLPDSGGTPAAWHFELAVANGARIEPLQIDIEERQSRRRAGSDAPGRWCVTVTTDVDGIGPLSARVTLSGSDVSVSFRAATAHGASRIEAALPELEDALGAAGLNAAGLHCAHAAPRPSEAPERWPELLGVDA